MYATQVKVMDFRILAILGAMDFAYRRDDFGR